MDRHDRIVAWVKDLLCGIGCHNWGKGHEGFYTGRYYRSCYNCSDDEDIPRPAKVNLSDADNEWNKEALKNHGS